MCSLLCVLALLFVVLLMHCALCVAIASFVTEHLHAYWFGKQVLHSTMLRACLRSDTEAMLVHAKLSNPL
jgi:hypothetical protein